MKIETLNPLEILPTEPPWKKSTVGYLRRLYENSSSVEELSKVIPYVFVHFVEDNGLLVADGNHRIGVAQMYGKNVNVIHIDSGGDFDEALILRNEGKIPFFEFGGMFGPLIPYFSRLLPSRREKHALEEGVKTFDDFVECIQNGMYFDMVNGRFIYE